MQGKNIFRKFRALSGMLFLLLIGSGVQAGNFKPGNVVVVRVGSGNTALTNASTPVFLDEYTPAGLLVQSVSLPVKESGSNHILTLSGKAITEGALSLSADGRYLVLVGFDTIAGYANVSTGVTNRTIALVDSSGTVNTSSGYYAGSAYVLDNFRSGFTNDGTGFWTAGAGNNASGGTWYTPFGSFSNAATQLDSTIPDTRVVRAFDGQLYFTADDNVGNVPGLYKVGSGTPTTANQPISLLPGFDSADSLPSPFAFVFFDENPDVPGVDVVYICDDDVTAPVGGLYKFSLVNGTWVYNGNITNANGLRGLTGLRSCSSTQLFLTAQNAIYSFIDTGGYNEPLTGSLNQLGTSSANTAIRGIAFAPGTSAAGLKASISAATNVSCNGGDNGLIVASVSGGASPFTYKWNNGATSLDINGLVAGNYALTVTDTLGCSATVAATIQQPLILGATDTIQNVSCYKGSNGSIKLAATGGTPPYTFNGGGSIISNLTAGTYNITVTDSNNCTAGIAAIVGQSSQIIITDSVTNLPCTGGDSGVIRIYAVGGVPSYSYSWNNESTSATITSLVAGNYSVTITDSLGCTATLTANVSQSGDLTATPVISDVICYGLANGTIMANASGGTAPYNYVWSNQDTGSEIMGLMAGAYTLTLTDNGNCTLVSTFNVSQPDSFAYTQQLTNPGCFGASTGVIQLNINGGTTPYTYAANGMAVANPVTGLAAGIYAIVITDDNNCKFSISDTLTQPGLLQLTLTATNDTVYNGTSGSVLASVSGGTAPYSFTWSPAAASDSLISGLAAGDYCADVTDRNGCSTDSCILVTQPSGILNMQDAVQFYAYMKGVDLFVHVSLNTSTTYSVEILDLTGRAVWRKPAQYGQVLDLQVPGYLLSSGAYLFRMFNADGLNVTLKIQVLK
jgi:hypothetical protein